MPTYDYVIAGGGLAGLSLACHLVRSPLCGASILIVDRSPALNPERLWSYWTTTPTLFDPIVAHAWSQVHVANRAYEKTLDLPGYRYELIRGGDLDRFARRELALHANVTFQAGVVERVDEGPRGVRVVIDGRPVTAGWVFDSTHWPTRAQSAGKHLTMYFKGWTVEAHRPVFNPLAVTFLDTRTPQRDELRFFYVLPFSDRQALVEYVAYSRSRAPLTDAPRALPAYLKSAWGLTRYDIVAEEAGALPILPGYHRRRLGPHHLTIGAKAGLIKPSTGFAFTRIQQDSADIVRSLLRTRRPWSLPPVSERHRLYDGLLLEVLARQGREIETIFAALFARNPIDLVLRFLDEDTTPAEDLDLIATLPARSFLAAMPRHAALRAAQWLTGRPH
jgi:lycopene beta-cyclase